MKKVNTSNAQMKRFTREAEELFNNFGGDEFVDNFDGDDENYDGDDENYDGDDDYFTGGMGLDKIDPNDRTLSFSITNKGTSQQIAELFAAFKNANKSNFGQHADLDITLGESSYYQFLQETISNPMLLKGLRYFVTKEIQLSNTLELVEESATGTTTTQKYQPGTKIDPRSFKNNILIDPSFTMPVTGRHALRIPVNAGETITLIMYVSSRVDQAKSLQGKAVVEVSKKKKKKAARRIG